MQIDDYGQAIALKNKLEAALPFRVRPGKQLMKAIEDKSITPATWLDVDTVMYLGDEGGIMVNLLPSGDRTKTVYSTSLTHVVFDPEHELAAEVLEYQRQRTRRLMLQNRRGFAAELLEKESLGKRKPKRKGFG
ncbi:hypothetical protein [Nodosilinea sp. P-1105]|uniref:hypothetical protein n=1 Tax=Nodosilinea sp. P-1105 TaxID=2546229 RepID=UPI00146B2617|nr:hypothetical protein [Nodosilinea sp. P-1105]NMF81797.1 hypothetical protein [Nodosilinea sp. P-1105]